MKCPYCGIDLEQGRVSAGEDVVAYFWSPEEEYHKGMRGYFFNKGGERIDRQDPIRDYVNQSTLDQVYYCEACKKLIVDFDYGQE